MPVSTYRVQALVENVRKRWRTRALIQGISLALLTALFFTALFFLLYFQTEIDFDYLLAGLAVAGVIVLYVAIRYAALPFFKKLDDRQIAMYIEERIPGLEDRLNSAIEVGNTRPLEDTILGKLVNDASRQITAIPLTTVVDQKRQQIMAYGAGGLLVLFLIFAYNRADDIISVFTGAKVTMAAAPEKPYMSVSPGSVEIEKGESQEVITSLRDESEADVMLHYKIGAGEWQKESMNKGVGQPTYLYQFINIQEPVQYFIVHDQVQSETYDITLYEFPAVAQIDLRYTYPSYTGIPARTEENTGDIRGLKGATVDFSINTTGTVQTAEMVFESGRRLTLTDAGGGQYQTKINLETDDYYHIELTDRAGKANKFPIEYQVVVLEDQPPVVKLTDPQRDVRVNAIDEVLIAAEATDDYGVKELRLHISVNGEDEEVHPLIQQGRRGMQEADGDYVVFLEDFTLEPGDIISYYVEAEDFFDPHGPEATDMYFIEVVPFDQRFTQQNNMGGMQGGGGMQSRTVISQQEIIAATWRLHRERDRRSDEEFKQSAEGLVQAQNNLMNDIEERLSATTFSVELRTDEEVQKVAALLRDAVKAMKEAVDELEDLDLEGALSPERRALNFLLKADALNRDRNVTMNRNQQQGGGGGGSMEDRMTELMDLELDISRDKYEIQQQSQSGQQEQQQQMDDALERIKELARRQQRIANQNQQEQMQGEDKKRYIERLKRDQDELRQQTENLAQNLRSQQQQQAQNGQQSQSGESSQQVQEGLERAMEHMREAERALRNNDEQRAAASQQQALNELDKLQQDLRIAGAETTREMLDDLTREFEDINKQEDQLAEDIERVLDEAMQNNGRVAGSELDRLEENRSNLRARFSQFKSEAEAVEKSTRAEDPDVASSIRNMLQQMRRDELEQKLEDSEKALTNRWLDYAEQLEEEIQTGMERMQTQMRELENTLPQTDEEQLRRALSDLQDLQESLEEMEAQSQNAGQQPGQSAEQQGQQGQQGGQQGGGQNGSRQNREAAARMQRQLEQAREAMERLEGQLEGNQAFQRQMQQAERSMRRLTDASNTGVLLDEESAKSVFNSDTYKPFSDLETALAKALNDIEMEKKLYGARRAQVPDEYREAVDKYYESLSKSDN